MLLAGEQDHFSSVTSCGAESLGILGMAVKTEVVLVEHTRGLECTLKVHLKVLIAQECSPLGDAGLEGRICLINSCIGAVVLGLSYFILLLPTRVHIFGIWSLFTPMLSS